MSFWEILKLALRLVGIWFDMKKTQAEKDEAFKRTLALEQAAPSLAVRIDDKVKKLRQETMEVDGE